MPCHVRILTRFPVGRRVTQPHLERVTNKQTSPETSGLVGSLEIYTQCHHQQNWETFNYHLWKIRFRFSLWACPKMSEKPTPTTFYDVRKGRNSTFLLLISQATPDLTCLSAGWLMLVMTIIKQLSKFFLLQQSLPKSPVSPPMRLRHVSFTSKKLWSLTDL